MGFWNKKVGLALGGGGVKGFANIGVLEKLQEHNIPIHCIAGSSAGALVAAFYSFGKKPQEIFDLLVKLNWKKVSSLSFKRGIFNNDDLGKFITDQLGDKNIEQAYIPLCIVCTDIATGEKVTLQKGNLAQAVQASSAIPGLYAPVEVQGRQLVDGALCENVPISPLSSMGGELKVAVNLNGGQNYPEPDSIFDIISNGFDMAIDLATKIQLKEADHIIDFYFDHHVRTDVSLAKEVYDQGKLVTQEHVQRIKHLKRWPFYNEFWFALYTVRDFAQLLKTKLETFISKLGHN